MSFVLQLDDVDELRAVLRMPPDVYSWLLEKLRPHITFQTTNFRKPISAEERLAVTLRYLALGKHACNLLRMFFWQIMKNINKMVDSGLGV